jgi:hypothetical protein
LEVFVGDTEGIGHCVAGLAGKALAMPELDEETKKLVNDSVKSLCLLSKTPVLGRTLVAWKRAWGE